ETALQHGSLYCPPDKASCPATFIGFSLCGRGPTREAQVDGEWVHYCEDLEAIDSVDLVSRPARHGRPLHWLRESARGWAPVLRVLKERNVLDPLGTVTAMVRRGYRAVDSRGRHRSADALLKRLHFDERREANTGSGAGQLARKGVQPEKEKEGTMNPM